MYEAAARTFALPTAPINPADATLASRANDALRVFALCTESSTSLDLTLIRKSRHEGVNGVLCCKDGALMKKLVVIVEFLVGDRATEAEVKERPAGRVEARPANVVFQFAGTFTLTACELLAQLRCGADIWIDRARGLGCPP
jgi:hypothetical protein